VGFRGDLSINLAEAPKIPNKDAQDRIVIGANNNEKDAIHLSRKCERTASKVLQQKSQGHYFVTSSCCGLKILLRRDNVKSLTSVISVLFRLSTHGAYKLRLVPRHRDIHPVFHVSLLEPYYARGGRPLPPDTIIIDGEKNMLLTKLFRCEPTDVKNNI